MSDKRRAILWFRNDLRLADNPALVAALAEADEVLPVFILDEAAAGDARLGGAARWWLHHSLAALAKDLHDKGATLVLRRGDAVEIIPALAKQVEAVGVYVGLTHEPGIRAVDRQLMVALPEAGVPFKRYLSATLFSPETIKTNGGGYYNVFTPYSNACMQHGIDDTLWPVPEAIAGVGDVAGDELDDWKLLPEKPDWAGGMRAAWQPGEAGAQALLAEFAETHVEEYDRARNIPGEAGTSRLSPHSHYGEVSVRAVWRAVAETPHSKGRQTYLRELLWREFCYNLLWQHPDIASAPIRPEFAKMQWQDDKKALQAWQKGQTGIPIVDAGMRQLWQMGWMHNRVRMITASLLIKHMLVAWQDGEAWFWDTLCEADLAANSANWQWVAGCGADAAPYFRIFNPVLQGRKFDPHGEYVRQYVPELKNLPDRHIHAPWEAGEKVLADAGIVLGDTYPEPVVSLQEGRERALAAYARIRG